MQIVYASRDEVNHFIAKKQARRMGHDIVPVYREDRLGTHEANVVIIDLDNFDGTAQNRQPAQVSAQQVIAHTHRPGTQAARQLAGLGIPVVARLDRDMFEMIG